MRIGLVSLFVAAVVSTASAASPVASSADWDYSVEFNARSYPLDGIFSATAGASYYLWDRRGSEYDWQYGYLRTSATAASIGIVNAATGTVEVFPVSLFGVSFGATGSARRGEARGFDCAAVKCDGSRRYLFVEPKLFFGAGAFYGTVSTKLTQVKTPGSGRQFVEDESDLTGANGNDVLTSWNVAVGAKLPREFSINGYYSQEEFRWSGASNRQFFAIGSKELGAWSLAAGPGVYHSSHDEIGLSAVAFLKWTGKSGPGLADK